MNSELKDKLIASLAILFCVVGLGGLFVYCVFSKGTIGVRAASERTVIKNVADQGKELGQ